MTEKQMISTLKGLTFGTVIGSKGVEALEMAISALEQEPCEDAISRYDVLRKREVLRDENGTGYQCVRTAYIRELPSVTPKPIECDDAISREAAIEAVKQAIYNHDSAIMRLTELPSVTQKSIECDDAISREAVLEYLSINSDNILDYQYAVDGINELPSVQPSRKGHWITDTGVTKPYVCSECGMFYNGKYRNFCPNCGAEMVEPQESEDKE